MSSVNPRNFDYNLLPVLAALLRERHVSRVAQQLGLTQPAVSNALSRLREHFKDPLFVRTPNGMEPTPRARALEQDLRESLQRINHSVFEGTRFDPKVSTATFTIAATDYTELVILPHLCLLLAEEAPFVKLQIRPLVRRVPLEELSRGFLDIALGFFVESPGGLHVQRLYEERFLSAARKRHPRIRKNLPLKKFIQERHLLVAPWGEPGSVVDDELGKLKLSRSVNVTVPHFVIPPLIVSESDYLVTAPEQILRALGRHLPINTFPVPVTTRTFPVTLIWHDRTHREASHSWLRDCIIRVTRDLGIAGK